MLGVTIRVSVREYFAIVCSIECVHKVGCVSVCVDVSVYLLFVSVSLHLCMCM